MLSRLTGALSRRTPAAARDDAFTDQLAVELGRNFKALDGFMEYGLYSPDYELMVQTYTVNSARWRQAIRGFERCVGDEGDAHWEVVLNGVNETLPVSRRQQYVVREIGRENQ